MTIVLKDIIASLFSAARVRTSTLISTDEKVKWIPVLLIKEKSDSYMGVLENGLWVIDLNVGLKSLDTAESYIFVMSLLEHPIHEIRQRLTQFFKKINIKIDIDDFFPFNEIISRGFELGSEYWASLAFEWYDHIPDEKKKMLIRSIEKIAYAPWASEKLQQRARNQLALKLN